MDEDVNFQGIWLNKSLLALVKGAHKALLTSVDADMGVQVEVQREALGMYTETGSLQYEPENVTLVSSAVAKVSHTLHTHAVWDRESACASSGLFYSSASSCNQSEGTPASIKDHSIHHPLAPLQ